MKKTNKHLPIVLLAALTVVLAMGGLAQQAATDKAVDPVCGMTVVKANAKATYDYKGTTYYFCNIGCKEAFVKEPDKYLKAEQAKAPAAGMGMMRGQQMGQTAPAAGEAMAGCPMMARGGMMPGRMGRMGRMDRVDRMDRMPMGPGRMGFPGGRFGRLFLLYGDKIEMTVENTKDGAVLKFSSKDPEVAKAIQVHVAEHAAMMKAAKEATAK